MRTLRLVPILLASLACWFVPEALAQKTAPKRLPVPAGFVADYDVKYIPNGDVSQELDIYYPEKRADKSQPGSFVVQLLYDRT